MSWCSKGHRIQEEKALKFSRSTNLRIDSSPSPRCRGSLDTKYLKGGRVQRNLSDVLCRSILRNVMEESCEIKKYVSVSQPWEGERLLMSIGVVSFAISRSRYPTFWTQFDRCWRANHPKRQSNQFSSAKLSFMKMNDVVSRLHAAHARLLR